MNRHFTASVLESILPIVCCAGIGSPLGNGSGDNSENTGRGLRQRSVVAESFFHLCAGGEMERQVPADEILCVASNVSGDRRAGG